MAFTITSADFEHGQPISRRYTCEGDDISPLLNWSGAPKGTKSLALIVDDPDVPHPAAPKRVWVHWVLYDVPGTASHLPVGAGGRDLPEGCREGLNDWKKVGYGGPCPPIGRHRYFFKLYALDAMLGDLSRPTKAKLVGAMAGHVLATTELVGTYQKGRG